MNFLKSTISVSSRLTCERCHGHGYEQTAGGKVACGQFVVSGQLDSLVTLLELIGLKTNGVPTTRRELGFAIVQSIKQQTGLELISNFRAGKAVDETMDLYFFQGKSNRRHDAPPRRHLGFRSLAVLAADSSGFRLQASSELLSIRQEMSGEQG
jgi:hypothetical protein